MSSSPSRLPTSPNRHMSTSRKGPPPSTKSRKNKARRGLENAINKINLPNTAIENIRNNQNPNNAIFIDEHNERVYKFGLWLDEYRCIRNEFIAYTLLLKEKPEDMNKHYPEMFDCQKIEGTKYAVLTLKYIPDIQMVCFPSKKNLKMNLGNNESSNCIDHLNFTFRNNLINDAYQYLNEVGIEHKDEEQNLFVHTVENQKTFLWMDFEAAEFNKNKLNMCSKLLLQKNVKISYANSNRNSFIPMGNLQSSSPNKKRKSSNNYNASNLTNRFGF